jgi:DNA-directed RNA polymerase specialized sigma24 family protein
VDLADVDAGYLSNDGQVLAIDDALQQLAADDKQAARLVELRYFAGLSVEEAAAIVGIARSTAYEHWAYARASLCVKLELDQNTARSTE